MDSVNIDFIKTGMSKYKNATNTYFAFRKYVNEELQEILRDKINWKNLKPKFETIKNTRFGDSYPLLNARIECELNEQNLILVIAVNWYESESEIPFYCIWCENLNYLNKNTDINEKYIFVENQLRFFPNFEKLNMKEDFNLLIDEYIKVISE